MRAATVVQVLQDLFYVPLQLLVVAAIILSFKFYYKFYCMFYFACNRSLNCTGFSGFVPRVMNTLGLTFARATHEALNEFTDMMLGVGDNDYADCYDTSRAAARAKKCPPKPKRDDNALCHIGCSTEPPKPC